MHYDGDDGARHSADAWTAPKFDVSSLLHRRESAEVAAAVAASVGAAPRLDSVAAHVVAGASPAGAVPLPPQAAPLTAGKRGRTSIDTLQFQAASRPPACGIKPDNQVARNDIACYCPVWHPDSACVGRCSPGSRA